MTSICLPVNFASKWDHQGIEYSILGPKIREEHNFDKCFSTVLKTIENKMNAPVELREKEVYAFSFYFDRLNEAKAFKSINIKVNLNLKNQSNSLLFSCFNFIEENGDSLKIEAILNITKSSMRNNRFSR
jgi:hypothetical protein